jgi:hypothetical protein
VADAFVTDQWAKASRVSRTAKRRDTALSNGSLVKPMSNRVARGRTKKPLPIRQAAFAS